MRQIVDGILYNTDGLPVLASANKSWSDWTRYIVVSDLYRTSNGRYFFVKTFIEDDLVVRFFHRFFGVEPGIPCKIVEPADLLEVQQWCFDSGIDWEAAGVLPPETA